MGIGYRIKEARENLGFTQTELGKLIGVTGSAITNYENETSHPKKTVMYKLIEALKVDANYLFQDCVNLPKEINDVTLGEYGIIRQYRSLDDTGKSHINYELNREIKRIEELQKQSEYIKHLETAEHNDNKISNIDMRLIMCGVFSTLMFLCGLFSTIAILQTLKQILIQRKEEKQ